MASVDVRLIAPVRGVNLDGPDKRIFAAPGPPLSVTLSQQTKKDARAYPGTIRCEARARITPSRKVTEAFKALQEGKLPAGSSALVVREGLGDETHDDRPVRMRELAVIDALPADIKDFIRNTGATLRDAARSVVELVRWRNADGGPHDPFTAATRAEWKLGGNKWRRMPWGIYTTVSMRAVPPFNSDRVAEIQELIEEGAKAPFAHTLFREAWEQRNTNPRSALLLGIAAVEVGTKQYLSERVPDARWLLEKLQSPPVAQMLDKYVAPLADTKLNRDWRKQLEGGVELRNKVAHVGTTPVPPKELREILLAVRETLWWLDSLRGYEWAKDRRDLEQH
jgi:hypothetical protein